MTEHIHPTGEWPDWLTLGGLSGRECAQSPWLAWTIAGLCVIIVLQYAIIALHWLRSRSRTTDVYARRALAAMTLIFAVCSIAGYGTRVMMILFPFWSILIFSLIVLIGLNFWYTIQLPYLNATFERQKAEQVLRMRLKDAAQEIKQVESLSPFELREKLQSLSVSMLQAEEAN